MNVLMPQLGETVAEGKITKWFKAAGEPIEPGDALFEIETDKVSMEVPSTGAGVLREIRVPEGAVAPVGAVVAVIADGQQAPATTAAATAAAPPTAATPKAAPTLAAAPQQAAAPKHAAAPALAAALSPGRDGGPIRLDPFREVRTPERNFGPARLPGGIAVTPLARRLAAERGIAIAGVAGSGPHGRIVGADVEAAAAAPPGARAAAATAAEIKALYAGRRYREVPLDGGRQTAAARLARMPSVPQFHVAADIDVGRLLALRAQINQSATLGPPGRDGAAAAVELALDDFAIRALALALAQVPAANAVWAGDCMLHFAQCDIGIAVACDDGPVVPVVRAAETMSLGAISAAARDLARRARDNTLAPGECDGGAAAIASLGSYGVRDYSAALAPPHATMLAIGAVRRQAVETADGAVAFASLITATLACDHRVLDGVCAAQLLAAFKALMEAPVRILV